MSLRPAWQRSENLFKKINLLLKQILFKRNKGFFTSVGDAKVHFIIYTVYRFMFKPLLNCKHIFKLL